MAPAHAYSEEGTKTEKGKGKKMVPSSMMASSNSNTEPVTKLATMKSISTLTPRGVDGVRYTPTISPRSASIVRGQTPQTECTCEPAETRTVTQHVDSNRAASAHPPSCFSSQTTNTIGGVVPGTLRTHAFGQSVDISSCSLLPSSSIQPTTTSFPHTHSVPPRRSSTYPRPSPPTFLYPDPIVPLQHTYNQTTTSPAYTPGASSKLNLDLPPFPVGLRFILFSLIAMGFAWAFIVYYINFPPAFRTRTTKQENRPKNTENTSPCGSGGWLRSWLFRRNRHGYEKLESRGKRHKPVDKPSKYARVPSSDLSSSIEEDGGVSTAMTPFLHNNTPPYPYNDTDTAFDRPIELKLRKRRRTSSGQGQDREEQQSPPPTTIHFPGLSHIPTRAPDTPGLTITTPAPTMGNYTYPGENWSTPSPSPSHDILPPSSTLQPRSSAEWLKQREAFFNPSPQSGTNNSHQNQYQFVQGISHYNRANSWSPSDSCTGTNSQSTHTYSAFPEYEDVEALEAQVASQPQSKRNSLLAYFGNGNGTSSRKSSVSGNGNGNGNGNGGSWLNMVDGAVTKAVEKVVRFTEDSGGGEGLLLPVAKGEKVD